MPLEIRELHIKVTVSDDEQLTETSSNTGFNSEEQQENLVRVCVEQVLEILKDQKER